MKNQNLTLEKWKALPSVQSASGLVYRTPYFYIISDDAKALFIYSESEENLQIIHLEQNGTPSINLPKSIKPDFEALTFYDGHLYIFGSGSTSQRQKIILISEKTKAIEVLSAADLYSYLKSVSGLANEDFNIEGAFFKENKLYLFNRGNGPAKQNAIFIIDNWRIQPQAIFKTIALPKVKNQTYGFTDAILARNKVFFLAAAEDGDSTFYDGEVLGSIFGVLNISTLELEVSFEISKDIKFEGLTLYKESQNDFEFILCEDADDLENSHLYKLKISKENASK